MSHGGGGRAMAQLIDELFQRAFDNEWLRQANDQAAFTVPPGRLVMATDSHVVSPLFFPGGDIGCLSVHGTVNDVAMSGAVPLYLAASFILEEGFPLADLKRIVESMAAASRAAGVPVVTGDTKVVEKGKGDGVFITTTGVGVVPAGVDISGDRARPGDRILVSGTVGDHGVAIMSLRENLSFETTIRKRHRGAARAGGGHGAGGARHPLPARPHARRPGHDAQRTGRAVRLRHGHPRSRHSGAAAGGGGLRVPGPGPAVRGQRRQARRHLRRGRRGAAAGGHARASARAPTRRSSARSSPTPHHFVQMDTRFGGRRNVDWLTGEQLPRIC